MFALAALAIPIILHLFYFRRFKKVYFTNVRFLKEVKEESSARRKLRNLLVLAMRLMAFTFLVLAFAQPFIPANDTEVTKGRKAVSVFVDNSFSMNALSQDVPLIDKAKQRAREIVEAYSVEDEFQILTNDFEGRHQRLVSQEDALALIDEIDISPSVRQLTTVLTRQRQALNTGTEENQESYIISDFQRNITDLQDYPDTTLPVNLVPLQAVQERNISIDSAWFDAPVQMVNQTNPLVVRVKNNSHEDAENIRLSITYDGQTKPVGTLSVTAQGTVTDTVNITILRTGWHEAQLAITDYPVQFDDTYYFTFNVAEEIRTLIIDEDRPNRYLNAAFQSIEYFSAVNQLSGNIDYSQFPTYQMIVLNDLTSISSGLAFELNQYVTNGGNLLVFPGRTSNLGSFNAFLQTFPANELIAFEEEERRVGTINTEEFVFRDVFENKSANLKLPVSTGNYRMSDFANRREERLLTYRDGTAFLSKYQVGQGNLYLSSAPLNEEYNDLMRNGEIFIPMLYKMAISSRKASKVAYTIGRDEVIEADHLATSSEIVYKLRGQGEEFIPEQRIVGNEVYLSVGNQIPEAGFYDLFLSEGEVLAEYGFNYNRQESQLDYYSPGDLSEIANPAVNIIEVLDTTALTARIEERSQGITLWRLCLILALAFLAAEATILRLWKV
jgi:hypothetical protein